MPRARAAGDGPPEPPAAPPFDFEKAMADLEALVERLEQGDVPLEEALGAFERGMALTRACQEALGRAEQRVELLMTRADGSRVVVPFDAAAEGDEPE
jgi:exodeoxyribonuclease VII small subunit